MPMKLAQMRDNQPSKHVRRLNEGRSATFTVQGLGFFFFFFFFLFSFSLFLDLFSGPQNQFFFFLPQQLLRDFL